MQRRRILFLWVNTLSSISPLGIRANYDDCVENIILGSPLVKGAVMFGRGRTSCGILIEPVSPLSSSPTTSLNDNIASFRNAIWPFIHSANAIAPSHSRIFKELILVNVTPDTRPFARTPKLTVMRAKVLDDWKGEIEEIYKEVEKSGVRGYGDGDDDGGVWREEGRVREFVKSVIEGVMLMNEE